MRTHSDVLCKRLDELAAAVAAGPAAIAREFTMCIPVQPDRDADIVLSDAAQRIRELESENVRLNKRYDILAMHMAEVKAIADGCHENTLSDVVEHCLEALTEPPR